MVDSTGLAGQTVKAVTLADKYKPFPKAGERDALRITIKKNDVNILWNCYFTGDNANTKAFGSTYRKLITRGIEKKWSGTFTVKGVKKVKVKTKVWDKTDGKGHIYATGQKWSKISFYNKGGRCNVTWPTKWLFWDNWTRYAPGDMEIYSLYSGGGDCDADELQLRAAHEFGHIIGIEDGYNNNKTKTINSIMCDMYGERNATRYGKSSGQLKATGKDIEKALDAYKSNKLQKWGK